MFLFNSNNFGTTIKQTSYSMYLSATLYSKIESAHYRKCAKCWFRTNSPEFQILGDMHSCSLDVFYFECAKWFVFF